MSEIDPKDFFLEQQFGKSQNKTIQERRSFGSEELTAMFFQQNSNNASSQYANNPSSNRLSQKVTPRRSCLIRPQPKIQNKIIMNPSIDSQCKRNKKEEGSNNAQNNEKSKYQCPTCAQHPDRACYICRGIPIDEENNYVKFFEFIIDFKLGKIGSYVRDKKNQISNSCSINNFCHEFYNRKSLQNTQYKNRDSIGSVQSKIMQGNQCIRTSITQSICLGQKQLQQKINSMQSVHETFQCDKCKHSPIVGIRYHCNTCGDYDECEVCHRSNSHWHVLEKIEKCPKKKQIQQIIKQSKQTKASSKISTTSSGIRNTVSNLRQYKPSILAKQSNFNRKILEQKLMGQSVHHNHNCDQCQISPIRGNRYHCNTCEDYDECEQCHTHNHHPHPLQKIQKCEKRRQIQQFLSLCPTENNMVQTLPYNKINDIKKVMTNKSSVR